jgi:hypothetical protein
MFDDVLSDIEIVIFTFFVCSATIIGFYINHIGQCKMKCPVLSLELQEMVKDQQHDGIIAAHDKLGDVINTGGNNSIYFFRNVDDIAKICNTIHSLRMIKYGMCVMVYQMLQILFNQ